MTRRTSYLLVALALAMVISMLSGCASLGFSLDPQDLYSLPELPAKYTALNEQLAQILNEGAEYAAPVSGANIQPVQMVDLDGDGREEAVAFFRKSDEEKPLKIYIFTAEGDSYRQTAVVEGSGLAVYSIVYSDLNQDGRTELTIGWRVSAELQALTVYALNDSGPEEVLRTDYIKYVTADMDSDGLQELVTLRADPEGMGVADYYDWENEVLKVCSSARVSMSVTELRQQGRMTLGALSDMTPALFVTGVAKSARATTDILVLRDKVLSNIVLSAVTGVSTEIAMFSSLYPTDINGDGITEVPWPMLLPAWDNDGDSYQRIDWKQYEPSGVSRTALSTFHNPEDGWYLILPERWQDQILVSRSVTTDEVSTTFYIRSGLEPIQPFLVVSVLTGTGMERRAMQKGRFILSRQTSAIYTAQLLEANDQWSEGVTQEDVRKAFNLIGAEWSTEDN